MLDLSDQGREAEQMTEKRNGEERKERRKGGGEEAYREGTQGWKVLTLLIAFRTQHIGNIASL